MQAAVPSADLQKIFLEMMRTKADLEVIERERIRIENALLRSEADMRSLTRGNRHQEAIQVRRDVESLRAQLVNCDSQVQSYRRRMNGLEEELKEIETIERRRYALHLDTEKSYVTLQNQYDSLKRISDAPREEERPSYADKLSSAKSLLHDLKNKQVS